MNSSASTPLSAALQPLEETAQQGSTDKMQHAQATQSKALCVHCSHSGPDLSFSCQNQCSYHARCLDLGSVRTSCLSTSPADDTSCIRTCLHCQSPATKLEILPLALDTITIGTTAASSFAGIGKRPIDSDSHSISGYDANTPRTGRWTPSEISFRDTLQSHFTTGSLPLRNEYKLLDFLSDFLKSKQSRLTKKMKHANLSVQHYCCSSGYLFKHQAVELSRLEEEFVGSLPDQEQREIAFHMSRLWREHIADRLSAMSIPFDPSGWIESVECLERRLTEKQEKERMVKRRIMMGKAWSVDTNKEEGVFIDGWGEGKESDFDQFISNLENGAPLDGNAALNSVYSSFANGMEQNLTLCRDTFTPSDTSVEDHTTLMVGQKLSSSSNSSEPNFRFAAPFLAWIISYIERTHLPFEHVDIWCPSSLPSATGDMMAPPPSTLGSGIDAPPNCRLYFAGSASSSRQMVSGADAKLPFSEALSSEEIESLSLFGNYSEKFSFSNGCGLPGRVFRSGKSEWDQSLSSISPTLFERRGGAMQFGIQTAVAVPIRSSNVGRIVLVLYSRCDRERDDAMIQRVQRDVQAMNPCPRYKLIVDMGDGKEQSVTSGPATTAVASTADGIPATYPYSHNRASTTVSSQGQPVNAFESSTKNKIRALIAFLGENMPSNDDSPLSSQLHNIMSLRLVLLRSNRSIDEDHLVDSMLVLFESYLSAQRSPTDTTLMLARDFAFHHEQMVQAKTMRNAATQQMQAQTLANSPPHHIVPMPSERSYVPHLSLDQSNHSLPELGRLRAHMSAFSLTSIDHSKNSM